MAQQKRLQICPSTVARRCSDADIGPTSCGKRRGTEDVERKRRRGGERETNRTELQFLFLVRGVSGQHWCLMMKKATLINEVLSDCKTRVVSMRGNYQLTVQGSVLHMSRVIPEQMV